MSWRINNIRIKNFKFFKDEFVLNVNGKHLLLYGENGSGKSSIYWSFYTHYQSCYKLPTPEDAQKYFVVGNDQNLRNRFGTDAESSSIVIEYISDDHRTKKYEDSDVRCNTTAGEDMFMNFASGSSSFMNYKFLSSIFDFKNSEIPEIFAIFKSDIFPALVFRASPFFVHIDGSAPEHATTADYWWKYLDENLKNLRRGENPKYILKTSDEFKRYVKLLREFNKQIEETITLIEEKTNRKIEHDFHLDSRIEISYEPAYIEGQKVGPETDINLKLCPPQIIVRAKITNNDIDDAHKKVAHPRSFYNEATLTCMAVAMRFAVVDVMYQGDENVASALFLDDLLISLDMSTRLSVIDVILAYQDKYQILLFTHDYAFYDILKSRIGDMGKKRDWLFREMYRKDETLASIPTPLILDDDCAYTKALAYYCKNDYAASANALRRECEEQMKRLLPYNKTIVESEDGCTWSIPQKLAKMIDSLKDFYKSIGMPNPTPNLHLYRERILNPLSHYDVRTSIYKNELKKAIDEVKKLQDITIERIVPIMDCGVNVFFQIAMDNGNNHIHNKFNFCDEWLKYSYGGQDYYTKPHILVRDTNVREFTQGKVYTLNSVFTRMCKFAYGPDHPESYPQIRTVVIKVNG